MTWVFNEGDRKHALICQLVSGHVLVVFPSLCKSSNSYKCLRSHSNGLVQDCSNSIANALELLQFCTKPSICFWSHFVVYLLANESRSFYFLITAPHFSLSQNILLILCCFWDHSIFYVTNFAFFSQHLWVQISSFICNFTFSVHVLSPYCTIFNPLKPAKWLPFCLGPMC